MQDASGEGVGRGAGGASCSPATSSSPFKNSGLFGLMTNLRRFFYKVDNLSLGQLNYSPSRKSDCKVSSAQVRQESISLSNVSDLGLVFSSSSGPGRNQPARPSLPHTHFRISTGGAVLWATVDGFFEAWGKRTHAMVPRPRGRAPATGTR